IAHYVSQKDLKTITPKKEVKSRIYQLNQEQTLFIGGLVRMDFVKENDKVLYAFFLMDCQFIGQNWKKPTTYLNISKESCKHLLVQTRRIFCLLLLNNHIV